MAEGLWEQVIYGGHCMHGTPIGTPGGADLMCGWCEDGYTVWVDDSYTEVSTYWGIWNIDEGKWTVEPWLVDRREEGDQPDAFGYWDGINSRPQEGDGPRCIVLVGQERRRQGEWVRRGEERT